MISKNSVKEAFKLAKAINSGEKTLYIKKGSLVDELVKSTLDNLPSDVESDDYVEKLSQSLNGESVDSVKYDEMMSNYVRDIAKKASYTARHTIDVVAKEVLRFRDCFIKLDGDGSDEYNVDFFDVSFVTAPELLNTPFIKEILDSIDEGQMGYKRTPMTMDETIMSCLNKPLKEILATGIDYVDSCIDGWIDESHMLKEIYNERNSVDVLKMTDQSKDEEIARRTSSNYLLNTLEFSLLNMLIYRHLSKLRDEDGEFIKDITVPSHNNYRFWSFITKKRLISYRKSVAEGRIISPVGTDSDLISVLEDQSIRNKKLVCYTESIRKLKDRNVDITSLYGYILGGGDYYYVTIDELTEDHARLSNIYTSKIDGIRYTQRASMIGKTKWNLRKAYSMCFKESIKEGQEKGVFDSEDENIKIDYVGELDKDSISKKVGEYIDSLSANEPIALLDACIDIVAGIRYESYPAKEYLRQFKRGLDGFDFNEQNLRMMTSNFIGMFLLDNIEVLDQ